MTCPPQVPISIIPPVSQGQGPLVWQNGSQIARLNSPISPAVIVYDGSVTRWGDGSANSPIRLPAVQQVGNTPQYVVGTDSSGTIGYYSLSTLNPGASPYIYLSANGAQTSSTNSGSNFFASATFNTFSLVANGVYELECLLTFSRTLASNITYSIVGSVSNGINYATAIGVFTNTSGNNINVAGTSNGYPASNTQVSPITSFSFIAVGANPNIPHTHLLKALVANGSSANTISISWNAASSTPWLGSYAKLTRIA
jgi:hypothetical protein